MNIKSELEKLAVLIAVEAAWTPTSKWQKAYIPWELIIKLRYELEARNIDWRKIKKTSQTIMNERKRAITTAGTVP